MVLRLLKYFAENFNKESDEISSSCIQAEYSMLLHVSLCHPFLKSFSNIIVYLITLSIIVIFHLVMVVFCVVSSLKAGNDLIAYANCLNYSLIICTFGLGILLQFVYKRDCFIRIHRIIGNGVYDYNETSVDEGGLNIRTKYLKQIRMMKIIIPLSAFISGTMLFCFASIIDQTFSDETEQVEILDNGINYGLPIPLWVPYNSSGTVAYWATFLLILSNISSLVLVFISFNIVYSTICLNLATHLELLTLSIKQLEPRAMRLLQKQTYHFPEETNDNYCDGSLYRNIRFIRCLEECLKKNIEHHQVIVNLHSLSTELLGNPILTFYFNGGIMMALCIYAGVTVVGKPGSIITFFGVGAAQMLSLISSCKIGQSLIDLNEDLRTEVYSIQWNVYPRKINKLVMLLQLHTSCDFMIEAPFNFAANMNTLSYVLEKVYSYLSIFLAWNQ